MPLQAPIVERRSRITCHFPVNRIPSEAKPNQMRVVHEFIRFLTRIGLTGFTMSNLYESIYTGYWRASPRDPFEVENVVLIMIDQPLDTSDPALWDYVARLKQEMQRLYKTFSGEKEQEIWILVHAVERLAS